MPSDDSVERILVVTAHPDDVDFGSAGSVARWTDAGIEVAYCICTNGEAGGFDRIGTAHRRWRRSARPSSGRRRRWSGSPTSPSSAYPDGRLVVDHRPAARHQPGDPPGATAASRRSQSPGAELPARSTRAIPTTSPPARRRWPRCTPTPATRSRTPSCSRKGSSAVVGRRDVPRHRRHRRRRSSTSPRRSIARSTRLRCHVSQMTDVEGLDARIRELERRQRTARRAARGRVSPRRTCASTPNSGATAPTG